MAFFFKLSLLALLTVAGAMAQSSVYCASDDMRRHYCSVDTRGGVELMRQRSDASCIAGRTWGYDNRGIWVDRGCRADFALSNRYRSGGGYGGYGNGGYGNYPGNSGQYGYNRHVRSPESVEIQNQFAGGR